MNIRLSRLHFPVTALGPGERLGIWFQGCSLGCQGCISPDTWPSTGPLTDVSELLSALAPWIQQAQGITISGGEPFDQPEALRALLVCLREQSAVDILVYSGYPIGRLENWLSSGLIDGLITDPFRLDTPQTLALRGSDNQRLHLLTELGTQRLGPYCRARTVEDDRLDLMVDGDGTAWMAGIPRRGDLERLQGMLS